ncbi:Serine/Threonine kinase domain protein (macronuclear) [Tetrahymena thermophila SB210]|uniref:non-specific serine/threonine protein kinase n=1 Tax=Tetrahymena thermophila (strain SB210) TaxID=312017 RepID=I7M7Z4_TETTS|nr:Serine/Threonine kinase domain protein [Tetrahymena thermophila SB210]EAR96316.2 Serine/Threonine kinase domain protein [Tetrahymena thermophila SB210]|eukprot:XP_001016561.2 Serine/Threonine kinase domain protein [Tetrahymena thermophila SB210]
MIYTQVSDELSFKDIEASLDYDIKSYNIIQPLGQGANGFVCKIEDFKSKECYAMKVVDKKRKDIQNVMKRLDQEIKIQKELDHPNIIKLFKHFEDDQNHYLIMELAQNGEIKDYLNINKPLSESQILDFSYQLACGIKYLHDKDIVHRDLKLNNVLLSNGKIKIADFGLATKVNDENPECNTMCGTANYLSPEILNSKGYGKKTDIWSFGCILYALCSGNLPFFSGNPSQTIQNIKEGKWQLPQNISDNVKDLLSNTLNWDQNSRFSIEQVLSHKFYEKKHKQSIIIFNQGADAISNQQNKLSTPNKVLLDWTSPRFNAPIHLQQKSQSSQKKNKRISNLKNQKSLTSMKLDLSDCNKENQPNLINSSNNKSNNTAIIEKQKSTKSNTYKEQQNIQSNQQNSLGMSNIFLTTARSINLADNSIIMSTLQDNQLNNTNNKKENTKPTQKLQYYLQQNSNTSQQLKQSSILNNQGQASGYNNSRNRFDLSCNNVINQNKSQQSLLQYNGYKSQSVIPQQQQAFSQNSQQISNKNQPQQQNTKELTPKQFNPYLSQNSEKTQQDYSNNAFKSYRSTSSLHQNISIANTSQTYRNPLQESQINKNNQQRQEAFDNTKQALHNVKKPLQYFSQQQQTQKDGDNQMFTQSQNNNTNKQMKGDNTLNGNLKYSSLSTNSQTLNKNDESYIHNYHQPRIRSQQSQQNVNLREKSPSCQFIQKNQEISSQNNCDGIKDLQNINKIQQNSQIKRNYSQQITPKEMQTNSNIQKLEYANRISQLCAKGDHNFLLEKKSSSNSNNNCQQNVQSSKNIRSLSNSQFTINSNIKQKIQKDTSELSIQVTDRQITFQGNEQNEKINFTKSPTQIQTRNNSKSFSQSVNCAPIASSKERKVSFVAQSADLQEQIQIIQSKSTQQTGAVNFADSKTQYQSNDTNSSFPVSPLSTQGLKANKVNTKNGIIEISENNWLSIECQNGQLIFKISPNGEQIQIQKFQKSKYQKKNYDLQSLPEKYIKLYTYAKVVCQTLKSKTPLVKIQNEKGTFMLMSNQPKQNYEVSLSNGYKVSHVIGTDIMTVKDKQNKEFIVYLSQQNLNKSIPQEITLAVKVSLEQMSSCLQKQNEQYLANFK